MKKSILFLALLGSAFSFAQIEKLKDLKYETKIIDAENKYVVFPPKPDNDSIIYGVMYFDPADGFSFKYMGSFWKKDDSFSYGKDERDADIKTPWQNLVLNVGLLPDAIAQDLKLPEPQKVIKYSKGKKLTKDQMILERASQMNASGFSEQSIPYLEQLLKEKKGSNRLFFELAFAYNATKQHEKAKDILENAFKQKFVDDLLYKEMHFTYMYLYKVDEGANFLQSIMSKFGNSLFKSECILNQVGSFYREKKFDATEKWIAIYKQQIGNDRYKATIDQFENALNLKKNPVQ